jgi:hypothetical protein
MREPPQLRRFLEFSSYNADLQAFSKRAQAALILCVVLLLRLPFLNQAIQGDDFYYLKGAEHAQIDPLHPTHARYVFQGQLVDMRGHPHPPLNAWYLALLLGMFGQESEIAFHAAYLLFSLIAAFSAWATARRFTGRPLLATLLFVVTPAFVVNGNSLESDLPFVAFWLASIAFFIEEKWWLAALSGALAAFAAYQAVVLAPVLAWWLFVNRKRERLAWVAVLAAPAAIVGYQVFERMTSGALPATVLAGYMQSYNLQAFAQKLKNAGALTAHVAWLVFPAVALAAFWRVPVWVRAGAAAVTALAAIADRNPLFGISAGIGAFILLWCAANVRNNFLSGWILIFFAASLAIFFAGSMRYLLPVVAPLAILVSGRISGRWLAAGAAGSAVLSAGLAVVNYQHWGGYRDFARSLEPEIQRHRTWTNAEWGFRHYLESEGAMPVENGRTFWPGDLIVTTAYAPPPNVAAAIIAERDITSPVPLRIVAPGVDSAYSSISFGLAPFGISTKPMDRVRAMLVSERKAELSAIDIGTPAAAAQIISGVYNNDRWTSDRATVLLKWPASAAHLEAKIFIPPQAPARVVRLYVGGVPLTEQRFAGPGAYTVSAAALTGQGIATVTLEVDKTFSVPPDRRRLGVLLLSIGFR